MQFGPIKSPSRQIAIRLLAAGLLCLALTGPVTHGSSDNEKTRSRAQRALRSGDFQRAEELYRELLAKNDLDIDARLGLSQALLKQRRLRIRLTMRPGSWLSSRCRHARTPCWVRLSWGPVILPYRWKSFARRLV